MSSTGRTVVAVFGASKALPGEPDYESGVSCGRLLAEAGYEDGLNLVFDIPSAFQPLSRIAGPGGCSVCGITGILGGTAYSVVETANLLYTTDPVDLTRAGSIGPGRGLMPG